MSSRITHAVAALATVVVVAGCESARPPMAPSLSPSVASAPAASGALDARNTAMPGTRKPDARIVVRRGELDFSRNLGVLSLYGTRGFALTAHVSRSGGVIDAIETCFASNCQPGSTIPLTAAWSGTDLPATVTQDGMTYANVGSVATATTADVRFSGSLVAPPLTKRGLDGHGAVHARGSIRPSRRRAARHGHVHRRRCRQDMADEPAGRHRVVRRTRRLQVQAVALTT